MAPLAVHDTLKGTVATRIEVMEVDVQARLAKVVDRLERHQEATVPEEFMAIADQVIVPALEEIAGVIQSHGHECRVVSDVAEPVSERGQTVRLLLDPRYLSGPEALTFRVLPGDGQARIELPGTGEDVDLRVIPFGQITTSHVQRMALDFLERFA